MELSLQTPKGSKHKQKSQIMKIKQFADSEPSFSSDKLKQEPGVGILAQSKSSRDCTLQHCARGRSVKDDELVKYMSNLPGYLQHTEKGENVHDKAFNVGVLDWGRLEKWDSVQKHTPAVSGKYAPSTSRSVSSKRTIKSSTFSSSPQSKSHSHKTEHRSFDSSINSTQIGDLSRGVKPSSQKINHFHNPETSSTSNSDRHKERPMNYKIPNRHSGEIHEIRSRKGSDRKITSKTGSLSSHLRNGTHGLIEHATIQDGEVEKVVVKSEESDKRKKTLHPKNMLGTGASSSKLGSGGISNDKSGVRCEESKNREEIPESETNHHQHGPGEPKNIVILLPKTLHRTSSSREPQTSRNKKMMEEYRNSFTDGFSSEVVHSRKFYSEIPNSCPLPPKVETNSIRPAMSPDSQDNKFSLDTSRVSLRSSKLQEMHCDGIPSKQNSTESTNGDVAATLKSLDEELIELAAKKVRNSSPTRRFSFSLGRIGRSFSFKEGSSNPEFSSTHVAVKSGPVSSCSDDKNTEKTNGVNRAKSSPLRRLLDPLWKSKGSNLSCSIDFQSLKGNLKSPFSLGPSISKESGQIEERESLPGCTGVGSFFHAPRAIGKASSTIHAVLQLTVKNGLPLFRFVVENNSGILAATMKNMTSPGKDDLGQHYTFYSVNEIKRKSGSWMSQGSKVKPNGYVYNVVGQMKVSSPTLSNLAVQSSDDLCIIRESVLLGIDVRQGDQASHKLMQKWELASVIVKMPTENMSYDARKSHEDYGLKQQNFRECLPEYEPSSYLGENQDSDGITVILPGGDHGLPIDGVPSPLIDRWKSGGSCDCGGWDVGCRLRVLSNQNHYSKIPRTRRPSRELDCFELFYQGETQEGRPFLSLLPRTNGIYSVEFHSSASSLQAFFICVAVMSSRKLPDLSEMSYLSEEKAFQRPPNLHENVMVKNVRYAPNLPLSPVGRV